MNPTFHSKRIEDLQGFLQRITGNPIMPICDNADRRYALREIAHRIVAIDRHNDNPRVESVADLINWGDL